MAGREAVEGIWGGGESRAGRGSRGRGRLGPGEGQGSRGEVEKGAGWRGKGGVGGAPFRAGVRDEQSVVSRREGYSKELQLWGCYGVKARARA